MFDKYSTKHFISQGIFFYIYIKSKDIQCPIGHWMSNQMPD